MNHTQQHTGALRAAGLRVTAARVATLGVVAEHPHASADTIAQHVRERLGAVSKQAIYDILHALSDAGLLRRLSVDGRLTQYELESGDNHHHIVCRECGRLEDVPCPVQATPCMQPPVDVVFDVELAEVLYRGLCTDCQTQTQGVQP